MQFDDLGGTTQRREESSVALADTFNTVLNTLGDLAQLGFAPDIHGNALCFLIRCMAAF